MPKKIIFIFLIILILIPSIAKASLFDDLLSQIRGVINNIGVNNNKDDDVNDNNLTNNTNSVNQTPVTNFNPSGFCFVNEMQFGDQNNDVKELQKFLSQFPDIYPERLTTGYFGNLTKQAVIRFQNKFKSDILTPTGLKYGTGYVGQYTLDKLNEMNECSIENNDEYINNSGSNSNINIDMPVENTPPVSAPEDSSIIDDEQIEPEPNLPTVKIKTYCSDANDLAVNSASTDSTAEKPDIRKMSLSLENPNYEDANNITININNQIINFGDISGCQDQNYRPNIKHFYFDYQCMSNEREVPVTISWIQNNISKSFTKKIRVWCYQCKSEILKPGVFQYTIYHKDLKPEKIHWDFDSTIDPCKSNGWNTPYDSGYVAKCFGSISAGPMKARVSDWPDTNDEEYIYNPPVAINFFWIYCPLLFPEKIF